MTTTVRPLGRALRLEIEADPPPGTLLNLVKNPSGNMGAFGWETPIEGSILDGKNVSGTQVLEYRAVGATPNYVYTEPMPVTVGWYVAASWKMLLAETNYRARFVWLDEDKEVLSSAPQTAYLAQNTTAQLYGPHQVPTGAVYCRLRFDHYSNTSGGNPAMNAKLQFREVVVATASTAGTLGTNVSNLIENPSYETDLSSWAGTGSVTVTRDTAEHWHGVASARISNTNSELHRNWVPNPSFEVDLQGWTSGSGSSAVLERQAGVGTSGGVSLRVHGPSGGATFQQHEIKVHGTNNIPVNPATDIIRMRANVRVDAGWPTNTYVGIGVRFFDGANNEINAGSYALIASITNPAPDVFHTLDSSRFLSPGVAFVRPFVFIHKGGGGSSVIDNIDNVWVDAVMIELGGSGKPAGGAYFDGSTANDAVRTHAWTGTAHYSASTETVRINPTGQPGVVSAAMDVYASEDYVLSAYVKHAAGSSPAGVFLALDWYDGTTLLRHDVSQAAEGTTTTSWTRVQATVPAPANADTVTAAVFFGYPDPTSVYYVDAVQLELGRVATPFVVGSVSSADLSSVQPVHFVDILATTHDIQVVREALNVGTMSVRIVDAALDPSQSSVIRPGRRIRLMAADAQIHDTEGNPFYRPVFTGTTRHATVEYDLTRPQEAKRATITISATDNIEVLANEKRDEGVAQISELSYVLEGAGVPWVINGSGALAGGTVVYTDGSGSMTALDQIAVTRDTQLGYAWVDVSNRLQAWDRDHLDAYPSGGITDEDVYSDVNVSYDSQSLINAVTLHVLSDDTGGGSYGPYRDEDSIREWNVSSAEFTVIALPEDEASLAAFAQSILDANSTPAIRLNSMQLAAQVNEDRDSFETWWCWVDLYNLMKVSCARASIDAEDVRVTGITHTINGAESKWTTELRFDATTTVASPTAMPTGVAGGLASGGGGSSGGGGGTAPDEVKVSASKPANVGGFPELWVDLST